jgi:hypothetical protein
MKMLSDKVHRIGDSWAIESGQYISIGLTALGSGALVGSYRIALIGWKRAVGSIKSNSSQPKQEETE